MQIFISIRKENGRKASWKRRWSIYDKKAGEQLLTRFFVVKPVYY
jgi:hypothetical protein